jgi:acetyl-CoA C-acetyltransferase
VIKELDLNPDIVNVNGGAIALGHPVGATGAKLTVTLMHEMLRSQVKYGMVTLCMAAEWDFQLSMRICAFKEDKSARY